MAVIEVSQVNAWLAPTRFTIENLDVELEDTARTMIFARVGDQYDTSTWTTTVNTPKLVQKAVVLLVAAWEYRRLTSQASASEDEETYDNKLEDMAWKIVDAILSGNMTIGVEPDPTIAELNTLSFYPTDASTRHEPRLFTMEDLY